MVPKTTAPPLIVPNGRDASPGGLKLQAQSAVPPATARETTKMRQYAGLTPQPSVLGRGSAAAFTILEVLVASAIMGIVMFVLVSTANTSLQLWRSSSEKMAVDREGRSGLALLAWDLQNIVQPTNLTLRPWINTNIITGGSGSFPMLRFLTRKPSDYQNATDLGDICYVEYRYTNYSLVRAFVGSSATFSSLANSPPAFPTNSATNFETLATNVWRVKLWGLQAINSSVAYDSSSGRQTAQAENLASIEYRLGVMDQKVLKLYTGLGGSNLALAQKTNGVRWYQAIQPVPPPAP